MLVPWDYPVGLRVIWRTFFNFQNPCVGVILIEVEPEVTGTGNDSPSPRNEIGEPNCVTSLSSTRNCYKVYSMPIPDAAEAQCKCDIGVEFQSYTNRAGATRTGKEPRFDPIGALQRNGSPLEVFGVAGRGCSVHTYAR